MQKKTRKYRKIVAWLLCVGMLVGNQSQISSVFAEEADTKGTQTEAVTEQNKDTDIETDKETTDQKEIETPKEEQDQSDSELDQQEPVKEETKAEEEEEKAELEGKANAVTYASELQDTSVAAAGANLTNMANAMANSLKNLKSYSSGPILVEAAWVSYLRSEWCKLLGTSSTDITGSNLEAAFQWKPAQDGITPWDGSTTVDITNDTNKYDSQTKTFTVANGADLSAALKYASGTGGGYTINITADIDLNGAQYCWDGAGLDLKNVILDGQTYTIFNLGCFDNTFIGKITSSTVQNLTFSYANIVDPGNKTQSTQNRNTAIIRESVKNANRSILKNLVVEDSLLYSGHDTNQTMEQHYIAPFGRSASLDATDCYTLRNRIFGATGMHAGGAFARANDATITSSFSVDSQVFSVGQHSGGFISCSDSSDYSDRAGIGLKVSQCFTNNTVYGNKQTGVFIGAVNTSGRDVEFTQCYSSGSIEGTDSLGGFIGEICGWDAVQVTMKECYSTSIVGMQKGGTNLGGFIGKIYSDYGTYASVAFQDCYAAGEVGSMDIDVSASRTANKTVGGFLGSNEGAVASVTYQDCYYDKQTTAMREWETGTSRDAAPNLVLEQMGADGASDISGLSGVLTSDSKKTGAGLASVPKVQKGKLPNGTEVSAGFQGFSTEASWIYDGDPETGAGGVELHNCMYPQMAVFSKGEVTAWGAYTDLVKAFSMASVATVHEQVWDNCSNQAHKTLNSTTYDTVRDITLSFTLTSYTGKLNGHTQANGTAGDDISWKKENSKTETYGAEQQVVEKLAPVYNTTYNRSYYTAEHFAPGIEWFTVSVDVGGVKGTRRLRIIPSVNVIAGADQTNLTTGTSYNHAKDMKMAYSTSVRMANSMDTTGGYTKFTDITQGVFPDEEMNTDARKNIIQKIYKDGTTEATESTEPDTGNDKFSGIKTNFMTGPDGTIQMPDETGTMVGHPNTTLSVRLYKVKDFLETDTDGQVRISLDDSNKIDLDQDTVWQDKLNGKTAFATADKGRYIIEYVWVLPDARYVRDSKLLVVKEPNHYVKVQVKSILEDGITEKENSKSLKLYEISYAKGNRPTDAEISGELTNLETASSSGIEDAARGNPVLMACQKSDKLTPDVKISKISYTMKTLDGDNTGTLNNPEAGTGNNKIEIPMKYYHSTQEQGGNYYADVTTINKQYELKYDTTNNFYYVEMAYEGTEANNKLFQSSDLDCDVEITMYIDEPESPNGKLKLSKQLVDVAGTPLTSLTQRQQSDQFVTKLTGKAADATGNTFSSKVILNPSNGLDTNVVLMELVPGEYALSEIVPMNYKFASVLYTAPGATASSKETTNNITITITAGKTTEVIINNEVSTAGGGKGGVTNALTHK